MRLLVLVVVVAFVAVVLETAITVRCKSLRLIVTQPESQLVFATGPQKLLATVARRKNPILNRRVQEPQASMRRGLRVVLRRASLVVSHRGEIAQENVVLCHRALTLEHLGSEHLGLGDRIRYTSELVQCRHVQDPMCVDIKMVSICETPHVAAGSNEVKLAQEIVVCCHRPVTLNTWVKRLGSAW